ncbi:hypothetical protein AB0F71_22565 [Kitasatospora sp. NPDC028055]|uniref:hypothetical protein n=1 Tax=Kitasatospora sp. NPDC028055 TaxID=3155653 RepID=UPI0033D3E25F
MTAVTVVVAGAGAFLANNLSNAFGPDSVCSGTVSADALTAALGSGRVSEHTYGNGQLRSGTASCVATVSRGIFGNDRSVTVELRENTGLSALADDSGARLFAASANGGAAGAASDHRAWALLPEGCGSGLRVTVSSGDDGPGARELAGLSVAVANQIAGQRTCESTPMPAPHVLSEAGTDHDLNHSAICGLPGFTLPDLPGNRGLRETATTATDPLWACHIHTDANPGPSVSFTIGTEPRLLTSVAPKDEPGLGRARWVGPDEMVTSCQGKPTVFRLSWDGAQKLIPNDDETWKQFLAAGGKAIGCEPIL